MLINIQIICWNQEENVSPLQRIHRHIRMHCFVSFMMYKIFIMQRKLEVNNDLVVSKCKHNCIWTLPIYSPYDSCCSTNLTYSLRITFLCRHECGWMVRWAGNVTKHLRSLRMLKISFSLHWIPSRVRERHKRFVCVCVCDPKIFSNGTFSFRYNRI